MQVYKVVEIKKKVFGKGVMTSLDLQNAINEWAAKGWDLDKLVAGETALFLGLGDKDVFLLIFKKSVDFPQDIYLTIDSQQMPRPVSESEFRYLANQKKINSKTFACKTGMNKWQPLEEIAPNLADIMPYI